MSAVTFAYTLRLLRDAGAEIVIEGGLPRVRAPRSALTPELRSAVEAHRGELLRHAEAPSVLRSLRSAGGSECVITDEERTRWLELRAPESGCIDPALLCRAEAVRHELIELLSEDAA